MPQLGKSIPIHALTGGVDDDQRVRSRRWGPSPPTWPNWARSEASLKALTLALTQAIEKPGSDEVPSTKGTLSVQNDFSRMKKRHIFNATTTIYILRDLTQCHFRH
ncbi:hypothetical protein MJO28_006045, partial [Puccinia striiformis f. sp. tritici]